jgi:uncharacterized protein (TIGR00730 family)
MENAMIKAGYRQRIGLWWDFIVSGWQAMRGLYALSRIPYPMVTIFGGMRASSQNMYAQQASLFAQMCANQNIGIITGGGPGIMEAANCGAHGKTIGIGVVGVDDQFDNPCAKVIKVNHFYTRRWLLMRYSIGFIIFPGGIGTADELFGLLNERKHNLIKTIPIILIGVAYWEPMMRWFKDSALEKGFVERDYITFFSVTDDLQEALQEIKKNMKTGGKK